MGQPGGGGGGGRGGRRHHAHHRNGCPKPSATARVSRALLLGSYNPSTLALFLTSFLPRRTKQKIKAAPGPHHVNIHRELPVFSLDWDCIQDTECVRQEHAAALMPVQVEKEFEIICLLDPSFPI